MAAIRTAVALLAFFVALAATAQETTGGLIGTVTTQDGQPLPGVSVQLADPARGFERTVVSDREGKYQFVALPPARYELTVGRDGFRSVRRSFEVNLGRTVSGNVALEVGTFTDTIEVADEMPVVDVTSTVSGITVDADDLHARIPLGREITQFALLAPGVIQGDPVFDNNTPGQRLASISGASVAENSYQMNGLNITNFVTFQGSTFVPLVFVDEVQVKTGGYEAEFGRSTGGVVNIVTKSGTNKLRGAGSLYWRPEDLQETEPDSVLTPNEGETFSSVEGNASLGGPLAPNRLFYFLFARHLDSEQLELDNFRGERLDTSTPYWGGKVDWSLGSGHRLEGTFLSDRVDVDFSAHAYDRQSAELGMLFGSGTRERGGSNWILRYSGILGDNLLLTAQYGSNEFARSDRSEGDDCPRVVDARGAVDEPLGCWVSRRRARSSDERTAFRFDVDGYIGRHSLRAGIDHEKNTSYLSDQHSGGFYYTYQLNGFRFPQYPAETEIVSRNVFDFSGVFDTYSQAAYVQDSWSATPTLRVDFGLRWEGFDNRNGLGQTFIETDDQWAPRLGAVWDPWGRGRAKLFGSFGVYYLQIASATNILMAGSIDLRIDFYRFDGVMNDDGSPANLGEPISQVVILDGEVPDPREALSENFDPMSQDELVLGYEQMLGSHWTVGVRGVARQFNKIIEDYSIHTGLWNAFGIPCLDPALQGTRAYCGDFFLRLGNPGSDFQGWFDVDGDGELDPIRISAADLGYPKAERDYYAVDLTAERRFADGWMLRGAYTWSHSYGNYEGSVNSTQGQPFPGLTGDFDAPEFMEHSRGNLPNDRRHNLKLYGTYLWESGLLLGGNFYYRSGRPFNSFGYHPTDWLAQAYPISFYTFGEPTPRGCCGTTPDIWSLDLTLGYNWSWAGAECNARVDVFNLFGNDEIVSARERAEDPPGQPEPTYGAAWDYQDPRSVRIGFRVSF
jgi:outer membrane receptor protein involved in Fe transport